MDKSVEKLLKRGELELDRMRARGQDPESRMHEPEIAMATVLRRARSDRKGVSNYERVYVAATLSPDGLEFWSKIVDHFKRLAPTDRFFKIQSAERVNLILKFGSSAIASQVRLEDLESESAPDYTPFLDVSRAISESAAKMVIANTVMPPYYAHKPIYGIHPAFMIGVETFESHAGQRMSKAAKERVHSSRSQSYWSWIQSVTSRSFRSLRSEAYCRIRSDVLALITTEAFAEERKQAVLVQCCSDVGDVMRRYAGLGDDVLRSAVREFLISDAMEW